MALTNFANGGYVPLYGMPFAVGQVGSQTLNATGNNWHIVGSMMLSTGPGTNVDFAGGNMYVFLAGGGHSFANGGSSLRFGLQDLSSGGPDGTFDVYKDLTGSGGGGGLTGGAINQITFDTGSKTVTHGQVCSLGIHFTTRAGSDAITPSGFSAHGISEVSGRDGFPYSWLNGAKNTSQPLAAVLISSGGVVGWMSNSILNAVDVPIFSFKSDDTPDEYALIYTPAHNCTLCGARMLIGDVDTTEDFEVIHYTAPTGTPVAAITHTKTAVNFGGVIAGTNYRVVDFLFSTTANLVAGTAYGLAMRPTTTAVSSLLYWDGGSTYGAALRPHVSGFGTNASLGSRTNQTGAFSTTAYRIPCITPLISAIQDAGSSGGGGYVSF